MQYFQNHYEAMLHHFSTVLTAKDDREAVRRLMVCRQNLDNCIDDINEANKRKYD